MPSMMTHRILADEVMNSFSKDCLIYEATKQESQLYSLGTSGPDLFLFYGTNIFRKREKSGQINQISTLVHENPDQKKQFKILLEKAKEAKDAGYLAYLVGFILHWAFDSIAHPYVYNRCGMGKEAAITHRCFESQLDRGVLDWKQMNIKYLRTYDCVSFNEFTAEVITRFYNSITEKLWGVECNKDIVQMSLEDFYAVEQITYNPNGRKMKLIKGIEKIMKIEGYAASMVIPLETDPSWDAMNENKNLWHHPSTNEEHHESFKELYQQAYERGKNVLELVEKFLNDKVELEVVTALFLGNFHTGLPEKDNMQYFDKVPTKVPKI